MKRIHTISQSKKNGMSKKTTIYLQNNVLFCIFVHKKRQITNKRSSFINYLTETHQICYKTYFFIW